MEMEMKLKDKGEKWPHNHRIENSMKARSNQIKCQVWVEGEEDRRRQIEARGEKEWTDGVR